MKKVTFAQALNVEIWVDIEVPDDYSESDIKDYIQEFPLNVTVTETPGDYEHRNAEIYVHSCDYEGEAEVQPDTAE